MKIYKTEEFVNEKLDIKPITKTRLNDIQKFNFEYEGYIVHFDYENSSKAVFHFGNCEITVNKKGKFDGTGRYLIKDNIYYNYIKFDITDGKAIYTGCAEAFYTDKYGNMTNEEAPERINDKFYITFPKIKQILTNKEEFERAVSYEEELFECDFGTMLKNNNNGQLPETYELSITSFFEGYFFNYLGCEMCKFVDM